MNTFLRSSIAITVVVVLASMTTAAPADDFNGTLFDDLNETGFDEFGDGSLKPGDGEGFDHEMMQTRAAPKFCKCPGAAPCASDRSCKVLTRCISETTDEYTKAKENDCLCGIRNKGKAVCPSGLWCIRKAFCVKVNQECTGKQEGETCEINKNQCRKGLFCYQYADVSTCTYTCTESGVEKGGCPAGYNCMMDLKDLAHNNKKGACFNGT